MSDDADIAAEKALIMEMNQLITKAVESYTDNEDEKAPKKYLIYFNSPMRGRRLYLVTDDDNIADSTKRHIANYYGVRDKVSVEAIEQDAPLDEVPKYDSSDALYQDLWW